MDTRISANFRLSEVGRSAKAVQLGIDNTPTGAALDAAIDAATGMELVRALLGHYSISPNSWYRSPELNAAIGGSKTSDHLTGYAVDFSCPSFGLLKEQYKKLVDSKQLLRYD